jgi:hypothetical protein
VAERRRRWAYIDVGWHLRTGVKHGFPPHEGAEVQALAADEERDFDAVEDAVAWSRERPSFVLVRLGPSDEEMYSAGEARAYRGPDDPFPEWPPAGGTSPS